MVAATGRLVKIASNEAIINCRLGCDLAVDPWEFITTSPGSNLGTFLYKLYLRITQATRPRSFDPLEAKNWAVSVKNNSFDPLGVKNWAVSVTVKKEK